MKGGTSTDKCSMRFPRKGNRIKTNRPDEVLLSGSKRPTQQESWESNHYFQLVFIDMSDLEVVDCENEATVKSLVEAVNHLGDNALI